MEVAKKQLQRWQHFILLQDTTSEEGVAKRGKERYWRQPLLVASGVEAVLVQVATIEVKVAEKQESRWHRITTRGGSGGSLV